MKVTSLYVMGGQQCTQRKIIWFQIPISLAGGGKTFSVSPSLSLAFRWYDWQKYSSIILVLQQHPPENINCEAHVKSVEESE